MDDQTDYPADEPLLQSMQRRFVHSDGKKLDFLIFSQKTEKQVRMIDFRKKGYPDRMGSPDKQREGKVKKEDIT